MTKKNGRRDQNPQDITTHATATAVAPATTPNTFEKQVLNLVQVLKKEEEVGSLPPEAFRVLVIEGQPLVGLWADEDQSKTLFLVYDLEAEDMQKLEADKIVGNVGIMRKKRNVLTARAVFGRFISENFPTCGDFKDMSLQKFAASAA